MFKDVAPQARRNRSLSPTSFLEVSNVTAKFRKSVNSRAGPGANVLTNDKTGIFISSPVYCANIECIFSCGRQKRSMTRVRFSISD